jgi:hypothetical protein
MCGLYALLNFLNQTEWREAPADGLWYLLEACRHFGWFTPKYLTEGFEEHQLKAILDLQFANYRMAFESYFLDDVVRELKISRFTDLADRVVQKGVSIIASWNSRDHWVLVTGIRGTAVIVDSSPDSATEPLSNHPRVLDLEYGIVILRRSRANLQIAL